MSIPKSKEEEESNINQRESKYGKQRMHLQNQKNIFNLKKLRKLRNNTIPKLNKYQPKQIVIIKITAMEKINKIMRVINSQKRSRFITIRMMKMQILRIY